MTRADGGFAEDGVPSSVVRVHLTDGLHLLIG
jgi:hypothetical protein